MEENFLQQKYQNWWQKKEPAFHRERLPGQRGRPKKAECDKVQGRTIKLKPELWDFIKHLSFGRGYSTRLKEIIFRYQILVKRESRQLQLITSKLVHVDQLMKSLAQDFTQKDINQKLYDHSRQIKTLVNLLQFDLCDLAKLLDSKQYQTLEFCLYWSE